MEKMTDRQYTFRVLTEAPDEAAAELWSNLLANSDFSTHYVTPDFFVDPFAGGGQRLAVFAVRDGRADAVITGILKNNEVISGLAVRPQTAFRRGADRDAAAAALIEGVRQLLPYVLHLELYSWEPVPGLGRMGFDHEISTGGNRVVMLDLAKGPEQLFKDFSERRRTDIRKTMRLGLVETAVLETDADRAELYEIHKEWNRRKGKQPDNFSDFLRACRSPNRTILIARAEGKVIAGTYLRFCPGGVVEYAANNSLDESKKLRPNELLGWRAIEWACANGFSRFSFGASHTFLERFGGDIVSTHRYRLDRTFLKRHANKERLSRMAVRAYLSVPKSMRDKVRSAAAKLA